ncbi:hypothetical protein AVEN_269333-1, partial [Araneus ventricosus]
VFTENTLLIQIMEYPDELSAHDHSINSRTNLHEDRSSGTNFV